MTRHCRLAVWMLIAALALPAVPLLLAQQAEEQAEAADDAGLEEREAVEEVEQERLASEEDAPKPAAKREARPAASSRPATRAKQKPGGRADGSDAPSTKPTRELSAEEMLSQMLKRPTAGGNRPLPPLPESATGGADKTSGGGAVAPDAPVVNVLREGTFLVDRVGRIERSSDGSQAEFVFESDGTALQDPPVVIIPNLKLMQMEDAAANSTRDLRFRVSGMVTEYRGRNYVLLEKVVVVPEVLERF